MSQKMSTELAVAAGKMTAFRISKLTVLRNLKELQVPLQARFTKMENYKEVKANELKKKKKFGKQVVKASKLFYKAMRLQRKEKAVFKAALKDIRKNGRVKKQEELATERIQLKEKRAADRAKLKEQKNSPEFKLRAMIQKYALNILNTATKKELLEYRGIGNTLAMRITNNRDNGRFADLNSAGLTEKQKRDFLEGLVLTKLML